MKVFDYLLWLKSLWRRLRADFAKEQLRQNWWANGVSISPEAIIRMDRHSRLQIGQGALIGPYTILDLLSDPLGKVTTPSIIRIGERTAINEFNNIRASGGEIQIGRSCLLSQYVSIIGSNHGMQRGVSPRDQPWDTTRQGVKIGNDVWIGTHAVILPGTVIGSGCVIAAGAVVNCSIPDNTVAAGIPATVKKFREAQCASSQ
jgi:acetyltransferase-like isoleucine patch superfamily enzyme